MQPSKEKVRVYALARDLEIDSKVLLQHCHELGFDVKNQLSSLDPEQCDQLVARVRKPASAAPVVPSPARPTAEPAGKVKVLPVAQPKPAPVVAPPPAAPVVVAKPPVAPPPPPVVAPPPVTATKPVEPPVVLPVAPPPAPINPPPPVVVAAVSPPVSSGESLPVPTVLAEKRVDEVKVRKPAPVAELPPPVAPPPAVTTPPAVVSPPTIVVSPSPAVAVPVNPPPVVVLPPPPPPVVVEKPTPAPVVAKPAEPAPVPIAPPSVVEKPVVVVEKAVSVVADKPASPPVAPVVPPPPPAAPTPMRNLNNQNKMRNLNQQQRSPAAPPADPTVPTKPAPTPAATVPPAAAAPTLPTKPAPPPMSGAKPPVQPINRLDGNRPLPGQPQRPAQPAGGNRPAPTAGTGQRGPAGPGPRPGPGGPRPGPGGPQRPGGPTGGGNNPARPGGAVPSRPGQPTANADSKTAPTGAVKKSSLTAEQIERIRNGASVQAALRNKPAPVVPPPGAPTGNNANKNNASPPAPQPGAAPAGRNVGSDTEEDSDKKGAKGAGNPLNRDQRQKARADRARDRKTTVNSIQVGRDGHVEVIESQAGSRVKIRHKKEKKPITAPRKGKVPIDLPITVRKLSEAIGVKASTIITRFIKQGASLSSVTINSVLEQEFAEVLALEQNCELEIRKAADAEQDLIDEGKGADSPENLILRAPVVTIMGHVDHGKTSLLDKIRQQYGLSSDVVSTEAGGITQVIRAWRVEKDGRPVTFLDTPGHEAFTKMRARGAQVTDVAVIVVAATDGVMPQTEEAISHAKAANVAMVVAINKVDAASANDIAKTERQLYSLNVLPDNMGGDVPFLRTSARTGQGIDDLLETLALVAELRELKANPNRPAVGTCLEAHLKGDEGVQATLLVQAGTLRKGDIILCGATYGRVRAMYNDIGRSTPEAGPSVPVRVTGLDEVPNADDPFYVVKDIVTAREMAEKRKSKLAEAAMSTREPMKLENLGAIKIAELKVILKADFRGSIEAIRKELEKLTHDEVRVRVLHTGIGAVTASDVQLALTSPSDTIIVGFNAVPDDEALAMAEAQGVQIREYDIIYNLTNDIKEALQGKLKPREEVIHLGRAVVRDTFKISRVGTVAGCHVTTGTIERSSKVRIIRDGVVLYPPSERTVGLESLKRFKEDTKEVREGFECGIKVAGFDDIKVGDVIEAFRIDSVKRTL